MDAHAAEPATPPRPTLKRRAESTKGAAAPALVRADASRQPGFVRAARALRALVHAHAAEPATPPRPTLKRRAESTKGAAAPALVRADASRQPCASGASCAQRGRCAP